MYLRRDELQPLGKPLEASDSVVAQLDNEDWAVQFRALDKVRRLVCFAPGVLASSGQLQPAVERTLVHVQSLRSALAKNALRCLGELFVAYGAGLDASLHSAVANSLKRSVDTNRFIADEADQTLIEICYAASEGKLVGVLVEFSSHKIASMRAKSVWALAVVAQRLGRRKEETVSRQASQMQHVMGKLIEAVGRTVEDANPDVRLSARIAAAALVAWDLGGRGGSLPISVLAVVPPGLDLGSFDACDRDAMRQFKSGSSPRKPSSGITSERDSDRCHSGGGSTPHHEVFSGGAKQQQHQQQHSSSRVVSPRRCAAGVRAADRPRLPRGAMAAASGAGASGNVSAPRAAISATCVPGPAQAGLARSRSCHDQGGHALLSRR